MKSLFNIQINKRTFISSDIKFSYRKLEGFDFDLYLFPSVNIEKTSNDVYKCSSINYKFTGWTKINFNWLVFNFCVSIKNKC